MDLTQMKIFTAAAEALNFSSVAQQMFISQPTVTYQIKLLEKEVGQSLFKRSTHGVALTEAGTILYKNCATMCSMWENALISLRGLGPETDIRIGFSGNQFYEIASAFIPDYTQLEGSFHVILHSYPFEEKLRPLLANEVNFMFMFEYQIQDQEGLSMIPLSCSTFVAFMSKNHPLACREHIDYDDLTAQTIIISEEQKTHVPFQDILKKIKEPDFICVKDYSDQISTTLAQQD